MSANNYGAVPSDEVIAVLERIVSDGDQEITLDAFDLDAVRQAIRCVKTVDRTIQQIAILHQDFRNSHDDWSDGLRKGLQCVTETISENM